MGWHGNLCVFGLSFGILRVLTYLLRIISRFESIAESQEKPKKLRLAELSDVYY